MSDEKNSRDQYDRPQVEQIPTDSGPSVTAAGDSPAPDGGGPEWRPSEPDSGD